MSRNQNFKSYGRGKHSNHPNTVVHSSIQFDKLFCENSNKPTASKSAGTIGKWGITSFTSIRSSGFSVGHPKETSRFSSLNKKRSQAVSDSGIQIKRPVLNNNVKRECSPILPARKFFKSRNSLDDPNLKVYKSSNSSDITTVKKSSKHRSIDENKKQKNHAVLEENKPKNVSVIRNHEKSAKSNSKKMSSPKIAENNVYLSEDFNQLQNVSSPPKERDKPPIVLRIFKGTSQLISETGSKNDLQSEENETSSLNFAAESRLESHENIQNSNTVLSEKTKEIRKEKLQSVSPEPVIPTKVLRRRSPIKSPSQSPEKIVIKNSSRRNSEKSKSVSPDPTITVKSLKRRSPEKFKSPSPERTVTVKSLKHRSPEKLKSPSPEPTITTRSLRRRPAPPSEIISQPHTSPKRVLRSTKNIAPTGKIVITNINSAHPTVYTLSDDTTVSSSLSFTSPQRKDAKECRNYSNKHKNKQSNKNTVPVKPETEPSVKKIIETLSDIQSFSEADEIIAMDTAKINEVSETCLDSDRAELLQLLEDEEEEDNSSRNQNDINNKLNVDEEILNANVVHSKEEEPVVSNLNCGTESQLKIKIRISDIKKECKEVPQPVISADKNSLDSDTGRKSEIECISNSHSDITERNKIVEQTKENLNRVKEDDFRLTNMLPESADLEFKSETSKSISSHNLRPAISNKKGSIFKHRGTNDGNKKRLALYKHKWTDEKDVIANTDEGKTSDNSSSKSKALDSISDMELDDMPLTKFVRQASLEKKTEFDDFEPVTGVKCAKKNKDFYTVVRNVKKAHQIQESGEFQEFNDDVEYILDALQDNNPIGTRCLSAISLATKCTEPAFRMHVRAHGTVTKFFRSLHDATKDQSLGLCTATVMFVLSQDRLNMDLDRDSLELMLNLLESDASHTKALEHCGLTDSQLIKTRDKVRQICADIQAQGHAKHLNLDNITVGHLSMETLLSLTSKRAGEWFKEELRELGGLEHIIKTVVECCKHVDDTANAWSTTSLEKIRKVDRCLRVLENVTMQNEQNNQYLLDYQDGILIDTLVRMFKVCDYEIPLYPTDSITDKESPGTVLRECLIANLKVLINITHDYQSKSHGSVVIGSRPGVIESSLHVLLQVPQYIPKEEKFDLMLLTLILLINLVEHCNVNRKAIIDAKAPSDEESIFETKAREAAVKALITMFYTYEELARNEEKKTDAILEGENTEKPPTNASQKVQEDFIEETISMLVQKAGQNMEHTLIAAYVAMLVGYLIIDNEEYENFVRNHLPEKNFYFMVSVLQKFYTFMTLTASGGTVSTRGMKSIQIVIQKLINSDRNHGCNGQATFSLQNSNDDLRVADSSINSNNKGGDKNPDLVQNKFCESQNNSVNMAISAS